LTKEIKPIFKCGLHDFENEDPEKWDDHCAKFEHEYDLHTACATGCGNQIHIMVKTKLSKEAGRIPRGYVCKDCKLKISNAPEIKEASEK